MSRLLGVCTLVFSCPCVLIISLWIIYVQRVSFTRRSRRRMSDHQFLLKLTWVTQHRSEPEQRVHMQIENKINKLKGELKSVFKPLWCFWNIFWPLSRNMWQLVVEHGCHTVAIKFSNQPENATGVYIFSFPKGKNCVQLGWVSCSTKNWLFKKKAHGEEDVATDETKLIWSENGAHVIKVCAAHNYQSRNSY